MDGAKRERIAVVGAGGIGGIAAASLIDAGRHDVVVCARSPIENLHLDRPEGATDVPVRCLADADEAEPVDWVLLCTKAQDTESAAAWLSALCRDGTRVAVLQNGIDHAERVGPLAAYAIVVPTVVYYNAERLAPDRVRLRHIVDHDIAVADDADGRAFADLMAGTSLRVLVEPDFTTRLWRKLLVNVVVNPITALTRQRQRVLKRPDVERLIGRILDEAIAVAHAAGARLATDEADRLIETFRGFPDEAGSSMYFDVMAGRSLEAEALTGALVRAGERHGVATPINDSLLALLRALGERRNDHR